MYLTLHLILAHFLADYPLQSGKMVKYKYKSLIGLFLHTIMHVVVISLICLPFLYSAKVLWSLIVIFISHLLIDRAKIACEKFCPKINKFIFYALDQLLHILILLYVSLYFIGKAEPGMTGDWYAYYSDSTLIGFILIFILCTYFYDVTKWTFLNSIKPIPYKRDYKLMARNALVVVIAFLLYWLTR